MTQLGHLGDGDGDGDGDVVIVEAEDAQVLEEAELGWE